MSLMDQYLETYAAPQLDQGYGDSVVLIRRIGQTDPFTATWLEHDYEVLDSEGFLTRLHSRDFVFAASDVVIDGTQYRPEAGNRIALTENSVAKVFEIMPVGDRPAAELLPGDYRWKVHTKQIQ